MYIYNIEINGSSIMALTPNEQNLPLTKFESMLKTNNVYFFDSIEFEQIIHYYMDLGKNALAKKAIKLGLQQHPNSVILKLLKAELMIFDGELDAAELMLKAVQAIEPTNDEAYVHQATIFSKKDKHQLAINALKTALMYAEDESDILAMIGMEYLFLDNFDQAREHFIKCLDVDYEDYSSLHNVIYCFDMQSQHHQAVTYLNNYINKDPYSEVAWHQLGRQYAILENYKEAVRAFDYAVLIDEYFVGAFIEKAKALENLNQFEEAIENYKIALQLDDPTSFVFLRIGECYKQIKNYSLAIQYYKKAVHEDPLLDKGWIALTNLNIQQKTYSKALYHIKKALEIDEQNTLYWRKYAEINIKLSLYEEAEKAFQRCLILQDYELIIWVGLCDVLCFLGDYNEAIEILKRAQSFFKGFAEIEYRLSALYYQKNKAAAGVKHLVEALEIDFEYQFIMKDLFPRIYQQIGVQQLIQNFKK